MQYDHGVETPSIIDMNQRRGHEAPGTSEAGLLCELNQERRWKQSAFLSETGRGFEVQCDYAHDEMYGFFV